MKISASLYSNKDKPQKELITELDKCSIDYFHIDCNDDPSVFDDIREIRKSSKTPIDLHIITENPQLYLDVLYETPVERVCFQFENLPKKLDIPAIEGTSFGLALVSDTDVNVFEEYKDACDFVLIMTTIPGQSGGKFRSENFQKIRQFRNKFPGKEIEVDGGVNDEVGFILRMLGVQSVVSGSYLVNHESIPEALLHLRSSAVHSDFRVKDFMIQKENLPIVSSDSTVQRVIQSIDNYKMGFAIIEDDNGNLTGISSNADVRKGLLRKFEDLNDLTTKDIVNRHPTSIPEDATISEMLDFIHAQQFLISYLPAVTTTGQVSGAVSFINLIRSES